MVNNSNHEQLAQQSIMSDICGTPLESTHNSFAFRKDLRGFVALADFRLRREPLRRGLGPRRLRLRDSLRRWHCADPEDDEVEWQVVGVKSSER